MFNRSEFLDFMRRADEATTWDEIEVREWVLACEYACIDYFSFECPDELFSELDRVRKESKNDIKRN